MSEEIKTQVKIFPEINENGKTTHPNPRGYSESLLTWRFIALKSQ